MKGRYHILEKEGRFLIERAHVDDAGNYSCNVGSESKMFYVSGKFKIFFNFF